MPYENQTAVVTGAAGQIGAAIVAELVQSGARVLAVDLDAEALQRLYAADDAVLIQQADVGDDDSVKAVAARVVEEFGTLAMLANNAGIEGVVAPIADTDAADFDRVVRVNIRGPFLGLKHLMPLLEDGGAVVNTSSALGLVGAPGLAAYVTSKHAVIGLTKVAALEGAARGIRVNAVCPGPIEGRMITALESAIFGDSGVTFASVVPLGRHGTPAEIAHFIAFLLSDGARYITGTAHSIDGAMVAT
jgi:NAD(P)-dependent dehydrogenase (short-subunit alcohol dehydrogenase family)